MAPKRITIPKRSGFYRGDTWTALFTFTEDVSGHDFELSFKHSRTGPVVIGGADITRTRPTAESVKFEVLGTITDDIVPNLLNGDLQADPDDTWITFTIPVKGEYATGGPGPGTGLELEVNVTLSDTDPDLIVNVELAEGAGGGAVTSVDGRTGAVVTHYVHVQSVAATTWTVEHGLGFKPNVSARDTDGNPIEADIQHVDNDEFTLVSTVAVAGSATAS